MAAASADSLREYVMIFAPNAVMRWAAFCPMRPVTMMPTVFPVISMPVLPAKVVPVRAAVSASGMFRKNVTARPMVSFATVWFA